MPPSAQGLFCAAAQPPYAGHSRTTVSFRPGLIDLVKGPAIGRVCVLRFLPAAEYLINSENVHCGKLCGVLRRNRGEPWTVVMFRRELLPFLGIKIR
jgi:hypothetical protein